MSDTLDPFDENDVFDAASLNTRFESFKNRVNSVPLDAIQAGSLGPNHIGSLCPGTFAQTKVLTPADAVTATGGSDYFCDPITKQFPGYTSTDFETGGIICWERIKDSSGGSGFGTQHLEVNMSNLNIGNSKLNSLLIMANVEYCEMFAPPTMEGGFGGGVSTNPEIGTVLVTVISTVSSTGVRTIHRPSMRYTSQPRQSNTRRKFSVDISHRMLLTTSDAVSDVDKVEVLAACLHSHLAQTGETLQRAHVRFCQLTAIALHSKVN